MYENLLADKSAADLRKMGAQYGIPGAAKAKKADLIVKIAAAMEQDRLDRERAVNPASIDANVSEHPTTDPEINAKITAVEETPAEEFNRLTALPLSQQTKAIQKRIRQLSNLPENTGPREEAAASEAPAETSTEPASAAPAKPAKVRKIRFSQDELAMEENGHSDQGHEAIAATPVGEYPAAWGVPAKKNLAKDLASVAEIRSMMKTCPICHPEIVANTAHSGSSRAGMVINVPLRADGRTKAETVAEKLGALKIEATVKRSKGLEILTAKIGDTSLKLVWDSRGRYVYAESTFNSRKVRNVSEALRLAARKADAGE